jgi:hypothetical protein
VPISQPGDIECDPVTFALSQSWHPGIRNKDVLWVKDAGTVNPHKVYAIELPFAACGSVPPPPTPAVNACPTGDRDLDGDGLPDCWEDGKYWSDGLPGIALDGVYIQGRPVATSPRLLLCVDNGEPGFQPIDDCASPTQRDIFVEIDSMQYHQPNPSSVADVIAAFKNNAPAFAPTSGKCDGAGCTPRISLHVQVDEVQIPHVDNTTLLPCTGQIAGAVDFDAIKKATAFAPAPPLDVGGFGTRNERSSVPLPGAVSVLNAKRLAYHYGLFVHNQSPLTGTISSSSGCAELFGNDFMVSLGSWTPPNPAIAAHPGGIGSRAEQAGTFMHELGHNLGLRHGGVDNVNCKPHHVSVMNYVYQFPNTVADRPLNYSPLLGVAAPLTCGVMNPPGSPLGLNEACLNEASGIGTVYTGNIAYGPLVGVPAKPTVVKAGGAINWDKDSNPVEPSVSRDLNAMTSSIGGCPPANPTTAREFLEGSDDWQILQLNLRASTDFADGVSLNFDPPDPSVNNGTVDVTLETVLDLSLDIIDIKPADKNNTINFNSGATFGVAIFSRKSPDGQSVAVDATTIDPMGVTLRGIPPGPAWSLTVRRGNDCKVQDLNKDGAPDLVCQFTWQPGPVVSPGLQRAVLTGTTLNGGYDFHSSDTIKFVQ